MKALCDYLFQGRHITLSEMAAIKFRQPKNCEACQHGKTPSEEKKKARSAPY